MELSGAVALVPGATRGLGRRFAEQLRDRGATKVYATARRPETIEIAGVEALRLDITDPASVAAAAEVASDVTLLVNNAGISTNQNLITGDLDQIRLEMDTHYFGTLAMARAFAPVLAANGGGGILTVLSTLSWFSNPGAGAYAAAKAAAWSMVNSIRLELAAQGTQVTGVALGLADTDMAAGYDGPMTDPAVVVERALDGFAAGDLEVLVDDWSRMIKATLARDMREFYGQQLDAARAGAATVQ